MLARGVWRLLPDSAGGYRIRPYANPKAPSGRGLPRKRVGERNGWYPKFRMLVRLSPSVTCGDSSLTEGASFLLYNNKNTRLPV